CPAGRSRPRPRCRYRTLRLASRHPRRSCRLEAATFRHLDVPVPRRLFASDGFCVWVPPLLLRVGASDAEGNVRYVSIAGIGIQCCVRGGGAVGDGLVRQGSPGGGRWGGGTAAPVPYAKAASTSRTTDSGSSAPIKARTSATPATPVPARAAASSGRTSPIATIGSPVASTSSR